MGFVIALSRPREKYSRADALTQVAVVMAELSTALSTATAREHAAMTAYVTS